LTCNLFCGFGVPNKRRNALTTPLTMKAALLTEYGKPLEISDVPRPIPKEDEVLVKMEASGVCFTDVHILRGEHASPNPLPLIMGHEGVGRVVELGSEGGILKVGDRVGIGYVFGACGHCRDCLTGGENYCPDFDATGFSVNGCFAEYVCMRKEWANRIPEGISSVEAAPLMCAGAAAYASHKKTGVKAGETLAIFGLGGLGQYAIQIAKLSGVRVIAVDVSEGKLATAKALGADEVVVADENAGAVIQAVPADKLAFYTYEVVERGLKVVGSSASNRQEMNELLALAARGSVKGMINTMPFEEINYALTSLIEGRTEGRTVLDLQ
jgi:propanol-preferring alcohol dehydrogenase